MGSREDLLKAVKLARRGSFLYISAGSDRRIMLEGMAMAALCREKTPAPCLCQDCSAVLENNHPASIRIDASTFELHMPRVYSYPPPVVQLWDINQFHISQQMQLLIWLEMYMQKHVILMTAETIALVLPTILSRSHVVRDVPKMLPDPESLEKAFGVLQRIFKGELRIDETIAPEDGAKLGTAMCFLLMEDLEGRLKRPPRKVFLGSDLELQTLMKVLSRYLEAPKIHNFPLLLRSFQMLSLQNVR